ncbi:MAG: class I SAM-dependent methyltransferase [Dethiobacteria bacterium]
MEASNLSELDKIIKKEVVVDLPGKKFIFWVVENIEDLILDVADEDQVPCWADIWPASYGLARYIWQDLRFEPGEEVLELGAGMGLPGVVCAAKGANVTLSDFNPTALKLAEENAHKNGVNVSLLQEDWRVFSTNKQYDCLLASDILYDPRLNPFLGKIFYNNLKPGGRIIIAHPERKVTYRFIEGWYNSSLFAQEVFFTNVELEDTLLPSYKIALHLLQHYGGLKNRAGMKGFL